MTRCWISQGYLLRFMLISTVPRRFQAACSAPSTRTDALVRCFRLRLSPLGSGFKFHSFSDPAESPSRIVTRIE
jgi:hypothetical protein